MKGKVVTIGPESELMEKQIANLSSYGFKIEHYRNPEACLNDFIQGFDPDAVLFFHNPPESDAASFGHLLTEEHKFHVPLIALISHDKEDQRERLTFSQGVFAVHISTRELQSITHSVTQAAAQKQLLRISQNLAGEYAKLTETLRFLTNAAEVFMPQKADEPKLSSEERIKNFRETIRGHDFQKEVEKAETSFKKTEERIEKVRKYCFKY